MDFSKIFDLGLLAIGLVKLGLESLHKNSAEAQKNEEIAQMALQIAQQSIAVYEQHKGEPINPSLLKPIDRIP